MALTNAQIEEQALKAKRLRTNRGEREAHSLKDLIAAQEYLDGQDGTGRTSLGQVLKINKIKSGGTIPTSPT